MINLGDLHDGGLLIPVPEPTARERLTRARLTRYRWEVLRPDGTLVGVLAGVKGGSLSWEGGQQVQGSGRVTATDLPNPVPGRLRVADIDLRAVRLRPWLILADPNAPASPWLEVPLGAFTPDAAPEDWSGTGRTIQVGLLDKTTDLEQDGLPATFTCPATTPLLTAVAQVIEAAGQTVTVDVPSTDTPRAAIHWPAGTSRLTVVNDLLDLAGYVPLWVDGQGRYRATPHTLPGERSTVFDVLPDVPREFVDGEHRLHTPTWTRTTDGHRIPNRIIGTSAGTPSLTSMVENTNPDSPWSIPSRGRAITRTMTGVEVPAQNPGQALFDTIRRELVAVTAAASTVSLTHLPVPLRPGDAVRFASTPAGVDALHVVKETSVDVVATGLQRTTLLEVPRV